MSDNPLGGGPSSEEKNSDPSNFSDPNLNSQANNSIPTAGGDATGNPNPINNNNFVETGETTPINNSVVPPTGGSDGSVSSPPNYGVPPVQPPLAGSTTPPVGAIPQQPSYGAPPQQPAPGTPQPGGAYTPTQPTAGNPYQAPVQGYGPVVPNAQTAVFPQKKKSAAPWIVGIIAVVLVCVFAFVYFSSDSPSNSISLPGNSLSKMNGYIENDQNTELKEYIEKNPTVDLDEYSTDTYSPVYTAIYYENPEALQILLDAGADPNLTDTYAGDTSGKSPLFFALYLENSEALEPLIAAGSDVNAATSNGITPLMIAVTNGEADTAVLLSAGADTSAKTKAGWSVLSYTVYAGNQELYEQFAGLGLDESIVDKDGYNLAHIALYGNEVDMIPFLENRGLTLSTQGITSGDTLLHIAGGGDAVAYVLDNFDVDVNALNNYGETPLCYKANTLDAEGVKLLLEAGSDPNFQGSDGMTPLMYATANYDADEVIPVLIAGGADVTIKNDSGNDAYYYGEYYELSDSVLKQLKPLNA